MTNKKTLIQGISILIVIILLSVFFDKAGLGPQPEPVTEELFDGITYKRFVWDDPRPVVVHVIIAKINKGGVRAIVTPPDNPKSDQPLLARTTSEFLKQNNVQVAINGDGFSPWYSIGPFYYPHTGDTVSPKGFAMYNSKAYADVTDEKAPVLTFGGTRAVDIGYSFQNAKHAISGFHMLVDDGTILPDFTDFDKHPRTAVGINNAGTTLYIVVVDGRQSGYSEGVTLTELAQIFIDLGAYKAMTLDGGGSSTLVVDDGSGNPVVLNSPIHQGIPGTERPVANHIGIFAKKK
jgi:hypothetical protein